MKENEKVIEDRRKAWQKKREREKMEKKKRNKNKERKKWLKEANKNLFASGWSSLCPGPHNYILTSYCKDVKWYI